MASSVVTKGNTMSILHNLVLMTLLLALTNALPVLQDEAAEETNYRLPTDVLPSYYIIKLVPTLKPEEFSFEGESSIKITVSGKNNKAITLHATNLTFDKEYTTLVGVNTNQTIKPVTHTINNVTDFLTVRFQNPLAVGSYWLNLKYSGQLNDKSEGFFRTSYVNEKGDIVWLAATELMPIYARRAFPCFDEPAMKAKFEISIKHLDNYTAISNMPAISKTKDKVDQDKVWTNFDVTPVMSTYLITFVVSDLKSISTQDAKFSCWTRNSEINNCRYALDVGPKALEALENYMGSGQFLPKIDNVAIPSVSFEATENWGIIAYREKKLIYEEGVSKTSTKQDIASTISHELAHQWFGNLVTPAWWNDLWLSEGFCNYFQYYITDKVNPNWRMMDQMVTENLQRVAFRVRHYQSEQPINTEVNSPSEIAGKYNIVPYYIGGSVIRMMSHVLSDKVMQTSLRQYSKTMAYGTATTDDLVKELVSSAESFSKELSLKEFLDSWRSQAGFPVVHVNRLLSAPGHVSISQSRFLPANKRNTTSPESWWIPINFATQSNPNFNDTRPSHWLKPTSLPQEVNLELSGNQWVIVNKQQTGLYRVNYDNENWELLADYLNTPNYTNIHVLNRAQLLDDSFNLLLNGYLDDHLVFLNISRYLAREDDYIPWNSAFRAFDTLNIGLRTLETHKLFKLYILKLIEKVENTVGYSEKPEDDHLTKLNRISVVEWACKMGSVKCLDATRKIVIDYANGSRKISPDLYAAVLCGGLRTANMTIWNKIYDLYLENKNEEDRTTIMSALACSSNPDIIKSYLSKVLDTAFMMRIDQDPLYETYFRDHIDAVVEESDAGADVVLDFVLDNFAALNTTYSNSRPLWFTSYMSALSLRVTTDARFKKLDTFVNKISTDTEHRAHKSRRRHLAYLKEHFEWSEKYEAKIRSFLLLQKLDVGLTLTSTQM